MKTDKKLRVFVSSAMKAFIDERLTIHDLVTSDPLLSRYLDVVLLENMPATGRPIKELVDGAIAESDLFVLLLGREQGTKTAHGVSYTQLEYNLAKARSIPCIVMVKGFEDEHRSPGLLADIRKDGRLYRRYANIRDFKAQLYSSLVQWLVDKQGLKPTHPRPVTKLGKKKKAEPRSKKIFLVHGRDEKALYSVARFVEKMHPAVVILSEVPSEGRTIIEKLEHYSEVGYAIILLTADDKGGLANVPTEQHTPRARQNVILELGYFIGLIGRKYVCPLYSPGVEIPSDYHGVNYIELDEKGAWKLMLAREMKAAGLSIDLNKAI